LLKSHEGTIGDEDKYSFGGQELIAMLISCHQEIIQD
jgi:hypothetical protein